MDKDALVSRTGNRRPGRQGTFRSGRFTGVKDASRFLGQLRYPTRGSTLRAAIDGVIVTVTLKRRGVRPLLVKTDAAPARHDPYRSIQVSAAVDAGLGVIPVAPTCLRRSITLIRELNRLGLSASMHIGVRNVGEKVEAHAWVQAGEVVLNDHPDITGAYVELGAGEFERLLPLLR
ncbi:MAG: lasso peptide biosynthesis B2 protein [Actinomycetota bacterium]|nr:lasso peptide biosynthesis B2 protein [Actinomycetota bacterium]